jgi:flagellar biosynthesis/type III secretory pathway chaperone
MQLESFLDVTNALADVMTQEAIAVQQVPLPDLKPIIDKRSSLGRIYEEGVQYITTHPETLDHISPDIRRTLKEAINRFYDACAQNTMALRTARDSRRFVLNAMREAALELQQTTHAYTRPQKGMHMQEQRTYQPVVLNEQL